MNRRKLLKSSLMAGAGALFSGNRISAAESNAGNEGEGLPDKHGSAILTKRRTLGSGKAALEVSALALGCMGMQVGRGIVPDEKMMDKLIQQAYERGCNFFDTAEGYNGGRNEEMLGRAIAPIRKNLIIGTKFTVDLTKSPPKNNNRPERIKAACEGSLRRLKIDHIDLYHQHRIDRSVPIEDVAGAVIDPRLLHNGGAFTSMYKKPATINSNTSSFSVITVIAAPVKKNTQSIHFCWMALRLILLIDFSVSLKLLIAMIPTTAAPTP